jgi:hypothetical protein
LTADFSYQLLLYCANQFQRGNVAPNKANLILQQAQTSFLDYCLGQMQQYQYGAPQSRVEYAVNETARLRLAPFIGPVSTLTIDATGLAPYPVSFEQVDAMYMNVPAKTRIRFVPQHKAPNYISDPIDPVDTNPIYLLESDGFRFYPNTNFDGNTLGTALISYVQTPPVFNWAYTPDANGRPIYNAGGSTGYAWYDVDCFEIISRALRMVGVNLAAQEISGYAQNIIDKGQ